MLKSVALKLLGDSITEVANAIGVSPSAISQWPDVLPPRIADRVLAVQARRHLSAELIGEGESQACAAPAVEPGHA